MTPRSWTPPCHLKIRDVDLSILQLRARFVTPPLLRSVTWIEASDGWSSIQVWGSLHPSITSRSRIAQEMAHSSNDCSPNYCHASRNVEQAIVYQGQLVHDDIRFGIFVISSPSDLVSWSYLAIAGRTLEFPDHSSFSIVRSRAFWRMMSFPRPSFRSAVIMQSAGVQNPWAGRAGQPQIGRAHV